MLLHYIFFFSSRRRHTRFKCDWSSDVCSSDLFVDSKAKAHMVYCISNAKQLTLAIHLYLDDQLNRSPGNTNSARSPFLNWTEYRKLIGDYVAIKTTPSPQNPLFPCPPHTFSYDMTATPP